MRVVIAALLLLSLAHLPALGQAIVLEPALVHLRSAEEREWSAFPAAAAGSAWALRFGSSPNDTARTLCLRQQDVKQPWRVLLNGTPLGTLVLDENDIRVCLPVPPGRLTEQNVLRVEASAATGTSDDIRVGEVALHPKPLAELLNEASLQVSVVDAGTGLPMPARITIVDATGSLVTTGTVAEARLAVRPGVVYSSTGAVRIAVPAGVYTVYAGRGFEYSLARTE